MFRNGLNLLVLGYGAAAILAGVFGLAGLGLVPCMAVFWLGGAIFTITLLAIRMTRIAHKTNRRMIGKNVIALHAPGSSPALIGSPGGPGVDTRLSDRARL